MSSLSIYCSQAPGVLRARPQHIRTSFPAQTRRLTSLTHGFREVEEWKQPQKKQKQQHRAPSSPSAPYTIFDLKICSPIYKSASTWNISADYAEPPSRQTPENKAPSTKTTTTTTTVAGGQRQTDSFKMPRAPRASMSSSSLPKISPLSIVLPNLSEEAEMVKNEVSEERIFRLKIAAKTKPVTGSPEINAKTQPSEEEDKEPVPRSLPLFLGGGTF
ncbi:hypothetical protein QBC44DRAFT_369196 [Cladorrhinum sp. PSN332]|nr:hypothetical protein QBC44DRAFT_369196 [Cladorrhinum sp. PSN332]